MKKTFIRRVTSAVIAVMMITMPIPSEIFAVETGFNTAEAAETSVTNIDTEAKSESGGVKSSSPETTTERGGFPDGTGEPAETSVTSVTVPPAETEVTTVTGETTAETAAPEGEISDETDTAAETSGTEETEETEQNEIDLLSLEDNVIMSGADLASLDSGEYSLGESIIDPSSSLTVNEYESITIDLNNFDLSIGTITIGNDAVLTIKGTGTISNTNIVSNKGQLIADGSNLTINGGSIQINEFKDYDTPGIINNGTLTIADTEINATSSSSSYGIDEYTCIGNTDSGTLIIDGTTSITANINSGLYGIHNEGYLTIQGNSVITARGNDNDVFGVKNYNKCVIKDWTKITAINEGKWDCEGVENYGNLVVNDNVTITSEYYEDSHNNYGIYVNDGASLEVNGGTISGKIGISYENSTVTNYINGGTIIGEKNGIINSGTLIINNANIYTTATSMVVDDILGRTPSGIYNAGDLTINGGNINGFADGVFSMTMLPEQPSKLTVNGGTISSTVTNDFLESFLAEMGSEYMFQELMPIMPLMIGNGINSCSETSIIKGSISGLNQGAFFAGNVNISGGTFSGGNADIAAGNEMFEMIMGMLIGTGNLETNITITGGTMGSIDFAGNTFNLSGAPEITEKIHLGENKLITINGELTGSGTYPIEMDTPGVFTTGANDFPDAVKHFSSFDPDYAVAANSDGELELAEIHRHDDEMEFLPWDKTDSLPTTSGYYYLTKDVTISEERVFIKNNIENNVDIKICLNGNKINFTADKAWLYVYEKVNLDIYDDSGEGNINNLIVGSYGGTLTLNNVTITREHDIAVQSYNGGTVTLNDTKVNGYADVQGGTLIVNSGTAIGNDGCPYGIVVSDSGKVVVNDGSITGSYGISDQALGGMNEVIINGGNICGKRNKGIMLTEGKLTVTGGTIKSNGGAIYVINVTFELSGNAEIDGEISVINGFPINITGELKNSEPYVIDMSTPGVFAAGEFAAQSAEKFTPSSELENEGYTVVVTENNELAIDYPHYTYGDEIALRAEGHKPPPPEKEEEEYSLRPGTATISLPVPISDSDNVILTVNETTVTNMTVKEEHNAYYISVEISHENGFVIGKENTITAEVLGAPLTSLSFGEDPVDMDNIKNTIIIMVDPKPISAEFADEPTKTYDGTTACKAEITSDGILKGDDVSIKAESCEFDSANAGTIKTVTASGLKITGEQKDFYKLVENEITGKGTITAKPLDIPASEFTYNGKTVLEIEVEGGENGEKVTAKLTAFDKNAGKYEYNKDATDGHYTVGFYANGVSSDNYTIGEAYTLTIKPLTAEIDWQGETSFVYDGTEKTVTAVLKNKVENDNAEFEFKGNAEKEAGKYTAEITGITGADKGNYTLEKSENTTLSWEITAADSSLTLSAKEETVTYGDTVSLTAAVKRTAANGIMTMSAEQDNVDFYIGEDLIGTKTVNYTNGSSGTVTLELPATSANYFQAGENKIRAEYGGSGNLSGSSAGITIMVSPKPVTAEIIGTNSKIYDGKNIIAGLSLQLNDIEECDVKDVQAAAESYTFNSANVKEADTITANGAELSGMQAGNYTLTVETIPGKITPANAAIPDKEYTYDGETVREFEIDGVNGEKVKAKLTAYSKNAGEYTYNINAADGYYTAGLSSTNYSINTAGTLTINKRPAEIKWQDKTSFVYDGEEKEVTAEVTKAVAGDTFNIVYENNTAADVGKYIAEIKSLGNDNYTLDGTENVTLSWEISPVDREETNVTINYFNETLSTSSDMEYSLDGEVWLPCTENMSVKTVGWNGEESLTVKFRYAADNNHNAGAVQTVIIPARPEAPDISKVTVTKTQDSITVTEISGCEYSIDGVTWQNSGKFTELNAGTEYTVQIRTKATENSFASFAAEKEIITSDTSSGTTELKTGETVETENGSITNDGKNVEIEDKNGNKTTVTLPDKTSDSVEIDESGNVQVPDGSIVQTGDTTVELPNGGTISPDGTIIADKVVTDNTTVSGKEVTVDKNGNITVSGNGTVQNGDTTVELPDGGTVKPDGTITADKVITNDTTVSGKEVTVDKDGNITVPENGTVQNGDTTVELPNGGTVKPDGTITADKVVTGNTEVSGDEVTVDKNGNITVSGSGTVQNGDSTVELPDGGKISPDGTITADKIVAGNTEVSGEEVTVDKNGNITVSGSGTVQNGDTIVELPNGGTVKPDGTITADKIVAGNTEVSGDEVTVDKDGNITVSGSGTVQTDDTTVELPNGGTVKPDGTITADKVVTNDTTVSGDNVTVMPDGNITVSGNGTVQSGDTTVTLPDGGKISPDGTITADKVVTGNTEVSGDEVTVDKNGNITVSGSGTVQTGDTTVTLPDGGKISPDGTITADKVVAGNTTVSGDEVTVDKNGNITVSENGTVQTRDTTVSGDKVTVDKDGNITLPNGGIVNSVDGLETIIGKDGSIKNSKVSIEPVNNTDYYDANGEAHSLNNGYIVLDIEPVKDIEVGSDISVIAAYDIRLLYNGKFEVQPNGTVKVTIIAPEGADGTEKVLHLNGNSVEDMNAAYDVNAKTFSFETDHFSVYVIAEKEVSDEPERKPSAPPTIPDRLPATTDKTENTDNNDNGEDVSSGAEIISSDEKISAGIAGNSGLKNILGYLSALAIAAAAAFIAKKNRQK